MSHANLAASKKVLKETAEEQAVALAAAQEAKDVAITQSERHEAAVHDKAVKDTKFDKACKEAAAKEAVSNVASASAAAATSAESRILDEGSHATSQEMEEESKADTAAAHAETAVAAAKKANGHYKELVKLAGQKDLEAAEAVNEEKELVAPMKAAQAARALAKKHMYAAQDEKEAGAEHVGEAHHHVEASAEAKQKADNHHKGARKAHIKISKVASQEKGVADEAADLAHAAQETHAEKLADKNAQE